MYKTLESVISKVSKIVIAFKQFSVTGVDKPQPVSKMQ